MNNSTTTQNETRLQEIRKTHNDISAMSTARNYRKESALLAWVIVSLGSLGLTLLFTTATVKGVEYVVAVAFISASASVGFGIGLYESLIASDYSRKMKNAQRKLARLINS